MSVRELLATHTSRELTEWQAYASVYGLEDPWVTEALGDIHEQLQYIAHLVGGQYADDDHENPAPSPTRYPRPRELRKPYHFEVVEDEEE